MQLGSSAVDREVALCRVGDDWELLQDVAQLFLDSLPEMLGSIRSAIDQKSSSKLELSAHSLKGSVANFGAAAATAAALALEVCGRKSEWAGIESAYTELVDQMEALRPELEDVIRTPAP